MTKFLARCDCCCCCCPSNQKIFACFFKISWNTHKKTHYEITDRVSVCECGCVRVCVRTCHDWVRLHKFPRKQKKLLCWLPQLESLSISVQFPNYPPLSLSLCLPPVARHNMKHFESQLCIESQCLHTYEVRMWCRCVLCLCLHTTVISRYMQRQSQCAWNEPKNLISCRRSWFLKESLDFSEKKFVSRWRTWFPLEELNFSI